MYILDYVVYILIVVITCKTCTIIYAYVCARVLRTTRGPTLHIMFKTILRLMGHDFSTDCAISSFSDDIIYYTL